MALAAAAVVFGPDRISAAVAEVAIWFGTVLGDLQAVFYPLSYDVMRGLAIGAYATFVALCFVAMRQGRPARMALVAVTVLWLFLIAEGEYGRWDMALLLAVVAALVMTRRALTVARIDPPAASKASSGRFRPFISEGRRSKPLRMSVLPQMVDCASLIHPTKGRV